MTSVQGLTLALPLRDTASRREGAAGRKIRKTVSKDVASHALHLIADVGYVSQQPKESRFSLSENESESPVLLG